MVFSDLRLLKQEYYILKILLNMVLKAKSKATACYTIQYCPESILYLINPVNFFLCRKPNIYRRIYVLHVVRETGV